MLLLLAVAVVVAVAVAVAVAVIVAVAVAVAVAVMYTRVVRARVYQHLAQLIRHSRDGRAYCVGGVRSNHNKRAVGTVRLQEARPVLFRRRPCVHTPESACK